MTILYPASSNVKTSRNARRFGSGLLPYVPHVTRSFEPTDADLAWVREQEAIRSARRQAEIDLDRRYDAEFARVDDGHWTDSDQFAHHGCV